MSRQLIRAVIGAMAFAPSEFRHMVRNEGNQETPAQAKQRKRNATRNRMARRSRKANRGK